MSLGIEVLHIARAINQGVILLEDLIELASRDDMTQEEADAIILDDIKAMELLRDND